MRRQFHFSALDDSGWMVLLSLAVLVAGTCIWLLYRYERRLVSRRLGWTLLALRLLTVGVVFLTLLEPIVTWSVDRERTGRVLISVDVSDSMATSDRHADNAERLRWLRATGMIGNDAVDARLDRYLEAFEKGEEPDWIDATENADQLDAEAVAARKKQFEELLAQAGEMSRKEIARRLIAGGPSSLEDRIDELAIVERQVFAGQTAAVDDAALVDRINDPGEALRTESSNLFKGITPVHAASDDAPLAGVVLFSDGRDNADPQQRQLLQQVATLGVPVYPVVIGSKHRPRDLAVGEVNYPRTIYHEDVGVITAQLRTPGFEGEELTVTLEHVDDPDSSQSKTIRPTDRTAEVSFEISSQEIGRQNYVLRLESQLNETREDNNERSFAVKVLDEVTDESRVLVLDGSARWEFRFLNTALTRDQNVTLETVVFRQPYLGLLPGTFFPRELPLPDEAAAAGTTESAFAAYDAIILGDVPAAYLPARAWEQFDRFVREEGGTLVMIAGRDHFPLTYQSPILDDLLPVSSLQKVEAAANEQTGPPRQRGFHLWLTPEGAREDMLQFDSDPLTNQSQWERLPGHAWGLKGRVKPAATVFVSLREPQGNVSLEFERANAIVAHQHVGAGQALWIGLDSTWRWREREGAALHDRFWGQLCRWAARFKASAGNEFVRFGLDRSEVDAGEEVVIRARWEERFLSQNPNVKAVAEVRPLGKPDAAALLTVSLDPVEATPGIHEGTATSLAPGEYEVRLVAEGADLGDEPIVTELFVAEPLTNELADLSANRDLLEQIADVSGGRLFLPDEVDQIPALFEHVSESDHTRTEVPLWDHWLVLLLCCVLLTTEWVLRKLNGLS